MEGHEATLTMLEEISAFLLVWGEAGNLRFMPELLYFLLLLLLAAKDPGTIKTERGGRSGSFLALIVRPIYHVIFDEHYNEVDIVGHEGPDKKILLEGYDKFLPADCANHDDWNELFMDKQRLFQALPPWFIKMDPSLHYVHLLHVDWHAVLGQAGKTHREVHSWMAVFGATHRIVLLHVLLFTASSYREVWHWMCLLPLIIGMHAILWFVSRVLTAGSSFYRFGWYWMIFMLIVGISPALVRLTGQFVLTTSLDLLAILVFLLPVFPVDIQWFQVTMPSCKGLAMKLCRWTVWICLFTGKLSMNWDSLLLGGRKSEFLDTLLEGKACRLDGSYCTFLWLLLAFNNFICFVACTQFEFSLACAVVGSIVAAIKRGISGVKGDPLANVPERFATKLALVTERQSLRDGGASPTARGQWSPWFPRLWDRIIDFMRYEDKLDDFMASQLKFFTTSDALTWDYMCQDVTRTARVNLPQILTESGCAQRFVKRDLGLIPDDQYPKSRELQWRLKSFAMNLTSPDLPKPFRAPYIPGITVLIPHYSESILLCKDDLESKSQSEVPLMSWLTNRYHDEYQAFVARQRAFGWTSSRWQQASAKDWEQLCEWASLRSQTLWRTVEGMMLYLRALEIHHLINYKCIAESSMAARSSEMFTCMVSMQMYAFFKPHQYAHVELLLQKHPTSFQIAFIDYEDKGQDAEADKVHPRQKRRYYSALIDSSCSQSGNRRKPRLRIELPGFPILGDGKGDNQNHALPFSRGSIIQVIDANQGAYFEQMLLLPCALGEFRSTTGKGLEPRIVGFAEHITSDMGSLGDFAAGAETAFGTILQRSYSFLGARMHYGHPDMMNKEFIIQQGGVSKATKTVNLSEDIFAGMDFTLRGGQRNIVHREYLHVTKGRDLGFNTILTFFAKLSAGTGEQLLTRQVLRLAHTLDLPEFLTCYYAHGGYYLNQWLLSKSVPCAVFLWLVTLLRNVEDQFLCNWEEWPAPPYYALRHDGYWRRWFYYNEMSHWHPPEGRAGWCIFWWNGWTIPQEFGALSDISLPSWPFQHYTCPEETQTADFDFVGQALARQYSNLLLIFLLAQSAPLFLQVCMERSIFAACARIFKQIVTLAPLHFIFQAKIVGEYVSNEIVQGGAKYLPTGRGLPTDRRAFIGKAGGLYNDYAALAFYDGARLLAAIVLVILAESALPNTNAVVDVRSHLGLTLGKTWVLHAVVLLTIISWLFAPFIFNPYQFASKHFTTDLAGWCRFFFAADGGAWRDWYSNAHLQVGGGLQISAVGLLTWAVPLIGAGVLLKEHCLTSNVLMLFPPVWFSFAACAFASAMAGGDTVSTVGAAVTVLGLNLVEMVLKCRIFGVSPCPGDGLPRYYMKALDKDQVFDIGDCPAIVKTTEKLQTRMQVLIVYCLWQYLSTCLLLSFCECLFRLKALNTGRWSPRPVLLKLKPWLLGHRMLQDMALSAFIFVALTPFFFYDCVRSFCCECSLHNILVYRDPGGVSLDLS